LQAVAKTEAGQKLSNQDLLKQASAKVQAAINKAAANLLQKNRQQRQQRAVGLTGSNAQTSGKKAADNFDDAFDFYASKKTG
jgi:UDP-N-acetylmuramyl pentapeptide synthase